MKMNIVFLCISGLILNGCAGTILTRYSGEISGGYPYKAIVVDIYLLPKSTFQQKGSTKLNVGGSIFLGIISIPLDLVIDTVFLPFDLGYWAYGIEKSGPVTR